jgi:hypothetical protein
LYNRNKLNYLEVLKMSIYRIRSVEKVEAEIEYTSHQIIKVMDELERLENKLQYLRSELEFNKNNKSLKS